MKICGVLLGEGSTEAKKLKFFEGESHFGTSKTFQNPKTPNFNFRIIFFYHKGADVCRNLDI